MWGRCTRYGEKFLLKCQQKFQKYVQLKKQPTINNQSYCVMPIPSDPPAIDPQNPLSLAFESYPELFIDFTREYSER